MYIRVAMVQDVPLLASLARQVWTEYYTPLLGEAQVDYMLKTFQSAGPIHESMTQEGMVYFLLYGSGIKPAGYCGWKVAEDSLFISKLYILKDFRGKGIAREAMARLEACAGENDRTRLTLTVNRHNEDSIAAYRAMGFTLLREQTTDIGGGFVMDDFVMEKSLKA